MSKGKCSETFVYEYFVIYYNQLDNAELRSVQEFIKHTESNIRKVIQGYNDNGEILDNIIIKTSDGFETNILDNEVIILNYNEDEEAEYIVLDYETFESIYNIEK